MLVDIPQEDYEFLKGLQHELLNQTDDGQADPIFWGVMERIEFAVPEDCGEPQIYLGDGYYDTIESVVALINDQIEDEYKEEWEAVDKMNYNEVAEFHRERMGNEETRVVFIKERDVLSQNTGAFLTKRACREYIDKYGYNHSKPRTFAMTAYRNFEYDHLLKIIKSLGESPWINAKKHKPEAVEQKEFGQRSLSKQVLCVYDDGKCHVERYDHDCNCWRWTNGYGQMHEPKMWRYIDIPEGGMK